MKLKSEYKHVLSLYHSGHRQWCISHSFYLGTFACEMFYEKEINCTFYTIYLPYFYLLALFIAKRSLKLENLSKLFPLSESNHLMSKRNTERFVINNSSTERYKRSAVPFLQRLLNDDYSKQRKDLAKLLRVNNGIIYNAPITYQNRSGEK